jgi:iron complex transport system substrate-binding protein
MKKFIPLYILLFATTFCACGRKNQAFIPGEILYEPRHAAGFTVYQAGDRSTAVRITDPWQGAEGFEQWVFVSHDDEPAPDGFTGTVLASPPERIVCMSSSYTAFLGELGASDRIVGVSGAQFITNSLLTERWRAGDVADVGYDNNLNFELLTSLRPDLILIYGVSDEGGGATAKYREMGVPYVFMGEYLEESPLARAEWIVALGAMLDDAEGIDRFETIELAYNNLKDEVAAFSERPEVMFNAPYRDTWYAPGDDNYMVRLVRDAGGEYVCRGVGGRDSRPISIEEAYVAMQKADFWLNTNHYSTLAGLLADNPRFAETKPVRERRVFNNNARTTPVGGSDFWESGAVRPDVVLSDLMRILHPEAFPADSTLYYYKRLQ